MDETVRVRELLAKATQPTEWTTWPEEQRYTGLVRVGWADEGKFHEVCQFVVDENDEAHAELVAEGIKKLPSLLDTAERAHALGAENKRLREMLERGLGAVNAAYQQAQAEYHNHDIKADKLDKIVCDWRNEARAALKGEGE